MVHTISQMDVFDSSPGLKDRIVSIISDLDQEDKIDKVEIKSLKEFIEVYSHFTREKLLKFVNENFIEEKETQLSPEAMETVGSLTHRYYIQRIGRGRFSLTTLEELKSTIESFFIKRDQTPMLPMLLRLDIRQDEGKFMRLFETDLMRKSLTEDLIDIKPLNDEEMKVYEKMKVLIEKKPNTLEIGKEEKRMLNTLRYWFDRDQITYQRLLELISNFQAFGDCKSQNAMLCRLIETSVIGDELRMAMGNKLYTIDEANVLLHINIRNTWLETWHGDDCYLNHFNLIYLLKRLSWGIFHYLPVMDKLTTLNPVAYNFIIWGYTLSAATGMDWKSDSINYEQFHRDHEIFKSDPVSDCDDSELIDEIVSIIPTNLNWKFPENLEKLDPLLEDDNYHNDKFRIRISEKIIKMYFSKPKTLLRLMEKYPNKSENNLIRGIIKSKLGNEVQLNKINKIMHYLSINDCYFLLRLVLKTKSVFERTEYNRAYESLVWTQIALTGDLDLISINLSLSQVHNHILMETGGKLIASLIRLRRVFRHYYPEFYYWLMTAVWCENFKNKISNKLFPPPA